MIAKKTAEGTLMSTNRRRFVRDMAAAAAMASGALRGATETVRVRVLDEQNGREVAARVRLLDAHGDEVVPIGHPDVLPEKAQQGDVRFQSRRFAYVDGRFELDPSRLPMRYQVIKGYEFVIAEGELTAGRLRDGAATIPLKRWSNLPDRGWYSGDIHIHHISPKTCHFEMDAEDVNVANILTSDFTEDQHQFAGKLDAHSSGKRLVYVSQEFRNNQLGHLCLLNLKKLIDPVKPMRHAHYPLLIDACEETRRQGGYVSWAHFPSMPGAENPLDVAMEKVDGLEILSVQDPRTFAQSPWWKEIVPEVAANHGLLLWYRYLNCGFRLTATAGTDKMTTFVTVGSNRVYARMDGAFSYQGWIDALKAGRTFITNSPILSFTVNGQEPGATLRLDSRKDKRLQIHARAESQLPYHALEIVVNGQVVAQTSPTGTRHRAEIHLEHPITESCWVAARVLEDLQPYHDRKLNFWRIHMDQGTLLSDHYGTRMPETVFAHSSPVYVIRDQKPIRSWDDAEYYVRYLNNCIRWLSTGARFARPEDKEASLEAFRKGRAVFLKRAEEAR
jgi:hypothetical protein